MFASDLSELGQQLSDVRRQLATTWAASAAWLRGGVRETVNQSAIGPMEDAHLAASHLLAGVTEIARRTEQALWGGSSAR